MVKENDKEKLEEAIDISQAELKVQVETIEKHSKEFELIERLRDILINGFNMIGLYKPRSTADEAKLLIVTRSFHSFRCSVELMKKAYYSQAVSILRMMTEDYFLCGNLEKDATIVESLLGRVEKKFNFFELATNMKANKVYETYKLQCDFSHCKAESIGTLIEKIDNNTLQAKIIPSYDETFFMMCCEMLLLGGLRIVYTLDELIDKNNQENIENRKNEFRIFMNDFKKWIDNLKINYDEID